MTRIYLAIGTWNSRLQRIGRGGFIAGLAPSMLVGFGKAIAEGYATIGANVRLYTSDIFGGDAGSTTGAGNSDPSIRDYYRLFLAPGLTCVLKFQSIFVAPLKQIAEGLCVDHGPYTIGMYPSQTRRPITAVLT